ncbi:MAG TPA: glycosyltransferase family 1 protein [Thermoplasmata archaeon]|nr:glycosyltransferase family 1 protein [Thermoplasmata archaeon]
MRILHLSMDYPPRHAGGTTVHTYHLVHELHRLGHEVHVVAASAPGAPREEDDAGVLVHRIRRPYTLFSTRRARALSRDVDVVHGHGICAYGVLRGRHPPTVVKLHNIWAQELAAYRSLPGSAPWFQTAIAMPQYVRMDRSVCRRAGRLISISEYITRGACGYGVPPSKINLIRNGVDVHRFEGMEPVDLDLEPPVVAYVGRLSPHKDVETLIRAFGRVGAGSLLIVGGGPSEPRLRRAASRLDRKVLFRGLVPHDEVPAHFLAADIIVHPSLYEPLGNAVLEGMAAGRPVIARRTGGIPEILPPEAGLLFDTEAELAGHLQTLMEDGDLRRRMGEAGRRIAGARSWADVARETETVLRRVVDEGTGGRDRE